MSTPPITVGPDASIEEAARILHRHEVKRLPVVDERGFLLGIVSRRDLLRVFTRGDEEIRAEIYDEIVGRFLPSSPETISVEVEKGVVRLTGPVAEPRRYQWLFGSRRDRHDEGRREVVDGLTVPARI
jgi:CBS domain-containing protein